MPRLKRGGKSGHQAMWLWVGSLPLSWLFGIPFGGVFAIPFGGVFAATLFFFGLPSIQLVLAMVVVLAGTGLLARAALNY